MPGARRRWTGSAPRAPPSAWSATSPAWPVGSSPPTSSTRSTPGSRSCWAPSTPGRSARTAAGRLRLPQARAGPGVRRRAPRSATTPDRCVLVGDIGADVTAAGAAGAAGILVPTPATRPAEVAAAGARRRATCPAPWPTVLDRAALVGRATPRGPPRRRPGRPQRHRRGRAGHRPGDPRRRRRRRPGRPALRAARSRRRRPAARGGRGARWRCPGSTADPARSTRPTCGR